MTYDPRQVVFLDTETTGLDPEWHEIWEVGLIVDGIETVYTLPINLGRADPIALGIGHYHERHPHGYHAPKNDDKGFLGLDIAVPWLASRLHGRHIVGAVPDFDSRFLTKLLTSKGFLPSWHYHLIDVEALMVGYLMAIAECERQRGYDHEAMGGHIPALPWKSRDLSLAVGVDPEREEFAQHTALGDARWAKACFEAVMGQPEEPS